MSPKWTDDPSDELQQGIERIRRLAQRISEAHDMVAANNRLLCRDRELIRSGPLHDVRDLRTHESQVVAESQLRTSDDSPRRRARRRR